MKPKQLFSLFATAEAITWTLLISALIARFVLPEQGILVTMAGGIHGAVFLGYAVTAVLVGLNQRWKFSRLSIAVLLAIVPFATVPFELRLKKADALDGAWRTTKSSDPRDDFWIDGLFRWFIARPLILLAVLVILIPAIFATLLWLGPPDQWFK